VAAAELIDRLADAGLRTVEAGSFVSPKWVPQMADTDKVMAAIKRLPGVSYPVLVPNLKGFEAALAAKADEIAIFAAASESFSQRNINCSIAESLVRFVPVAQAAKRAGVRVRGYVSCVLDCPYEGPVAADSVAAVAHGLYKLGCYEISLGDTIGIGTAHAARALIKAVSNEIPMESIAVHFHDTYGQALANVYACLEIGIRTIDASVSGTGGCPYAQGASGNLASEDLVYALHGMGFATGVDLAKLVDTGAWLSRLLDRPSASKVNRALHHEKP
jgi:isopropylmalate/homocitrate/citramalate synthase